ncbi:peptidoglycan-binding protein [Caldicellulosiruptor acetigenus]|uniref:peptidoglycan-binding protein n=1 Tax=Caldicellulosiruptor acetigenus TaxID=301953 RepID=UPI00040F5BE9|nr:peptidoglycan-binding protein [Caldicellulosiruptor acetigenus]WAM35835.1 peptidoglycan-binding protein [Caldicellulosiruptor acetigenus]
MLNQVQITLCRLQKSVSSIQNPNNSSKILNSSSPVGKTKTSETKKSDPSNVVYAVKPTSTPPNQGVTIADIEAGKKTLKFDTQTTNSSAVKSVQDRLKALGYSIGNDAYGTFGSGTDSAVRRFQEDNKRTTGCENGIDGIVGKKTWLALRDTNADDYKTYGKKVSGVSGLKGLSSDIDVIARLIYGECNDARDNGGQEAVAWTLISRRKAGGFSGGEPNTYRNIAFAPGQFAALTNENENGLAEAPERASAAWRKALDIAKKLIGGKENQIAKPKGFTDQKYFWQAGYFDENKRILANGQVQIKMDGNWVNVKDVETFGGNTFFNLGRK